jgi:hypothetical protein
VSDDSGQGGKRKREETLIEDYLTEREELASGPRFHVPPFTIKQIEGTRTTYYLPLGEDPEAQLEKMRGRPPEPAPGGPEPAPQKAPPVQKVPEPAPRPAEPAMSRLLDPKVPKAFAALQARALQQAANGPAPGEGTAPKEKPEGMEPAPGQPVAAVAPTPEAPKALPVSPTQPTAPGVAEAARTRVQAAVETVKSEKEDESEQPEGEPARPYEPARPVSFRRPFVKPDTFGTKRTGLPPLPKKVSAKELIARLRVVRDSVETRDQIIQRISQGQRQQAAAETEISAPEPEEPAAENGSKAAPAMAPEEDVPETDTGEPPALAPAPALAEPDLEQRSDGGKLCPSCGTPISEKNRLLICTDCGRKNCDTCGRYEKSHMKSDVYYEYQFDWPLCLTCYEKAYTIQRMLGRASVCYGSGNYSYARWYANNALQQDPESRYAPKINDLIDKINKANKAAGERDKEWRFARKQFSRQPAEDPRWRQ